MQSLEVISLVAQWQVWEYERHTVCNVMKEVSRRISTLRCIS